MGKILEHNKKMLQQAQYRAEEMIVFPSPLEERMKAFLDRNNIRYETQKIFYIYADDGWIIRYYIADFFIPHVNIIIEVDGKFHDRQYQHDKNRTKTIQEQYPEVEVLRYSWEDLKNEEVMNDLLWRIM